MTNQIKNDESSHDRECRANPSRPHFFNPSIPKSPFIFLALCVLCVFCEKSARADWTLTTADQSSHPHVTINEWSLSKSGGQLSYSDSDGKLLSADSRDIASLASDRATSPPRATWLLQLRNGDQLFGNPTKLADENLTFITTDGTTMDIPLKAAAGLQNRSPMPAAAAAAIPSTPAPVRADIVINGNTRFQQTAQPSPSASGAISAAPALPPIDPRAASDKDTLRFRTGDSLSGLLVSLDSSGIKIHSDLGDTPIKLDNIQTLLFAGVTPARGVPPLGARITFASGSVLTTPQLTWSLANITYTDPSGKSQHATADQITSIQVTGGRMVRLTELDPVSLDQSTLLGTHWPITPDKNVTGGPLRVARQTFEHGLGVHTTTNLTYELDGSFTTLLLRAGLDDSATPYGQAKLAVLLDGKTLWQSTMKSGQISDPLKLAITGGHKLELHAETADRLDVLGRVDWLDLALLRP